QEVAKMKEQIDQIQLEINEKQLKQKQDALQKATYTAAKDGIFLFQVVEAPQRVVAGEEPIGKIVDVSKLQFVSTVSENEVFQIKEGMDVDVRVTALKGTVVKGT